MKKIYTLMIAGLFSMLLPAQNYIPFPYDSVFFESDIPNSDLMPIVKKMGSTTEFEMVNPVPSIALITLGANTYYDEVYTTPIHWLGLNVVNEDSLSFTPNFKYFDNSVDYGDIIINLNAPLHQKDTFQFEDVLMNEDQTLYVEVSFDSLIVDPFDTIKEYSFQILDGNYLEMNLELGYELDTLFFNINKQVFQISKHNGILKSPDFAFFPYCRQYSLKGEVKDFLNLNISHYEKIFKMEVGDEFHIKDYTSVHAGNTFSRLSKKMICTQQNFDEVNQAYITKYDVWKRLDEGQFDFQTLSSDSGFVYSSFEQIVDTAYMADFDDLNIEVPNGMVDSSSAWYNHGYFLQSDLQSLMYYEVYQHVSYEDTILIAVGADGGQFQEYHVFGHGHEYNDFTSVWGPNYYKPVYVSTSDTTWGDPYSDTFLSIVENNLVEFEFFIQNNTIVLPSNTYFKDFRIYDINGRLLDYYKAENVSNGIDISGYPKGSYILIGYDGKTASHFKFIR